jgi:hypothetical protein
MFGFLIVVLTTLALAFTVVIKTTIVAIKAKKKFAFHLSKMPEKMAEIEYFLLNYQETIPTWQAKEELRAIIYDALVKLTFEERIIVEGAVSQSSVRGQINFIKTVLEMAKDMLLYNNIENDNERV